MGSDTGSWNFSWSVLADYFKLLPPWIDSRNNNSFFENIRTPHIPLEAWNQTRENWNNKLSNTWKTLRIQLSVYLRERRDNLEFLWNKTSNVYHQWGKQITEVRTMFYQKTKKTYALITDARKINRKKSVKKMMERIDTLSLGAGMVIGSISSIAWLRFLWPNKHYSYVWLYGRLFRKHWRAGWCCSVDKILYRDGYCTGYSYDHRSPLWVSYIACPGSIGVELGSENHAFVSDIDIPASYRTSSTDYYHTGYDRGHMAPTIAVGFSYRSILQAMLLTNVCLQHTDLNRQGWKSLETCVRRWVKTRGKHAIVVGPVFFLPTDEV